MANILAFIKRHPVPTYFTLVFAISWGGYFLVGGPSRFSATDWQADPLFLLAVVLTLAGPSAAGLLLTGIVAGRAGFRDLRARLFRWRVGGGWYAVALLTAPLLTIAVNLALSLLSPSFRPGEVATDGLPGLLLAGLASGLLVGVLEELGWTGFAIPRLRPRHGAITTALIIGTLWGAWHFPLFLARDSFSGALPLALLLVRLFSWLPAYRVLMVWVYDRTASLLVAMLMHASLSATQLIVPPATRSAASTLIAILVGAAAWWAVVAVVAVANSGWFTRRQLRMRTV